MLLITTIDMVTGLTEADCKVLAGYTAKDKIIVLSKEGAMMPVAMFQTLSSLKCQLEIKNIDTKDLFQLGYIIGRLTASVKNTEKIIILTNKEFDVDDKNIIRTEVLAGAKGTKAPAKATTKAPVKAESTKTAASAKSESKSASKSENVKAVVKPDTAKAAKSEEAKPAAKSVPKAESKAPAKAASTKASTKPAGSKLWPILSKYSKMKPYKDFVIKNEEALTGAILSASDAEITFKFQLQINFGGDGVAVWEILYKNFEAIQAAVKAAK